jgi:hypothetical protein
VQREEIAGPFQASGNWYRGCLHAHTAESDGWMQPDRLVAHYREAGYDFIALTDHEKLTDRTAQSTAEYLVLRGIEVASGRTELGERFHVVGIGVEGPISLEEARAMTAQQAIDAIRRLGGEAIVAHPYWSGLTAADLMGLSGYLATEVFNTTCQTSIGRGRSDYVWDEVLTRGRLLRAVASDDCHRPGVDSRRAWTMVRAAALTPPAILEALRQGHFYASTGPVIHDIRLTGDVVEVDCSPVQAVELI